MAGVDIGRKRWPGHLHVGVDQSHPLAVGLTLLFGKVFSAKRGSITGDSTDRTVAGSFGVSSDLSSGILKTVAGAGSAGPPVTIAAVFRWVSATSQMHLLTNDNLAGITGASATNRCWQFRCGANVVNFLAFDTAEATLPVNFTLAITSGVPYAVIVSVTAGRSAEMRLINLATSQITVVSSTASSTGNWAGNGQLGDTGREQPVVGDVTAVYRWNRNLTSQEMDMFLVDPFCMLRT